VDDVGDNDSDHAPSQDAPNSSKKRSTRDFHQAKVYGITHDDAATAIGEEDTNPKKKRNRANADA
jgi:hypothetical protein